MFKTNHNLCFYSFKTLFTTMFWITMRQYMQERREERSHSAVANMIAPLQVTVGTATGNITTIMKLLCILNL